MGPAFFVDSVGPPVRFLQPTPPGRASLTGTGKLARTAAVPVPTPDDGFGAARFLDLVRLARPTAHALRGACGTMAIHLELTRSSLAGVADGALRDQLARYVDVLDRERERLLAASQAFLALVATPGALPESVDVAALVHETVAALRPLATERRVRLDVTGASFPIEVTGSRERLRQQLVDLVLPVLEPAAEGAELSVRVVGGGDTVTITVDGAPALTIPRTGTA